MLHPRIKKELRLVAAPTGILASFALILLFLWKIESGEMWNTVFSFFGFGLALSYFVTCQFGNELSFQSLGWGMSMPFSRKQFWREKLKVMLPLYVTLSVLSIFSIYLFHQREAQYLGVENSATFYILCFVSLAWVCTGPGIFLTLKLKNLVASLWLTCLLPIFLTFLLFLILDNTGISDSQFGYLMFTVALIYGGAGWWLARAAFLKWEDKGMHATEMDWNLFGFFNRSNGSDSYRYHPWKAMVFRELRLQQTNLILGGILLAFGAIASLLNQWGKMNLWIGDELARFFAYVPQLISFLIMLIPASLACVTIPESRRLDVYAGEMVGPVRRRSQFFIKGFLTLFLGWLIAGILPYGIEAILTGKSIVAIKEKGLFQMLAVVIGILSLYAGSLCLGYLKSFSLTLLVIPLFMLVFRELNSISAPVHGTKLLWTIIGMLPFFLWRSYRNSLSAILSKRLILQNVLQLVCALFFVLLLLRMLADRSWERITLQEPTKEPSILRTDVEPSMQFDFSKLLVLSPDGTIWLLQTDGGQYWSHYQHLQQILQLPIAQQVGHFTQFASNYAFRFALDSQKHLWMWTTQSEEQWLLNKTSINFIPIMHERTWKHISAGRGGFLAVATDGTLWSGGKSYAKKPALAELPELAQVDAVLPNRWEREPGPVFDDDWGYVFLPVVETFTDWKDCLVHDEMLFALRENGQLYAWGNSSSTYQWNRLRLSRTGLTQIYSPYPPRWNIVDISGPERGTIVITTEDGLQWISSKDTHVYAQSTHHSHQTLVQVALKNASNGQSVNELTSKSGRSFLSKDGTIWKISSATNSNQNLPQRYRRFAIGTLEYHVNKMGDRTDWVAQMGNHGMTADGKIWNWDQRNRNQISPIPPRFRHKVVADLNP